MLFSGASGQPGGIQYQAIAREGSQVLKNREITVELTLLNDQSDKVWQESHTLQTNDYGLFTISLGNEPSAVIFQEVDHLSDLNWGNITYSLAVSVNEQEIGTNPVHAVPVALYGKDEDADPANEIQHLDFNNGQLILSGSQEEINLTPYVQSLNPWVEGGGALTYSGGGIGIGTESPESTMDIAGSQSGDEPIFQVKNYRGNPVFAVYNDGVWVYVDESAKGIKGGFAVGGYSSNKGPGQQFMRVTGDSTRVYFNEASKGIKGGFAVGGYSSGKAPTSQLMSLEPDNYLIGHSAGENLTGLYNQFMGYNAGANAGAAHRNVYIGYEAAKNATDGSDNVIIGYKAGENINEGYNNVLIGYWAGKGNPTVTDRYPSGSVIIGDGAGANSTGGWGNVFIGQESGFNNTATGGTSGARNVFVGRETGRANTSGGDNTYIGTFAGVDNQDGHDNVIVGTVAGSQGNTGSNNVYMGYRAGYTNEGDYNLVLGHNAGSAESNYTIDSDFYRNVMLGAQAGYSTTTGNNNTYVGYQSGRNNETGTGNVFIGYRAGQNEAGSDKLYIANSDATSTEALIFGDFANENLRFNGNVGINTNYANGYGLRVDIPAGQTDYYAIVASGDVWAYSFVPSDKHFKTNIIEIPDAIDQLIKLRGVMYDWDQSKGIHITSKKKGIGVIAQEVEKVFPELVRENDEGYKAVHYTGLIPVLIEAVKEQHAENQELKKSIENQHQLIKNLEERIAAMESK